MREGRGRGRGSALFVDAVHGALVVGVHGAPEAEEGPRHRLRETDHGVQHRGPGGFQGGGACSVEMVNRVEVGSFNVPWVPAKSMAVGKIPEGICKRNYFGPRSRVIGGYPDSPETPRGHDGDGVQARHHVAVPRGDFGTRG